MSTAPKFAPSDAVHDAMLKLAVKVDALDTRMMAGFEDLRAEFRQDMRQEATRTVDLLRGEIAASQRETVQQLRGEIAASQNATVEQLRGEIASSQRETVQQLRGEIAASQKETISQLRDEITASQAATVEQMGQYFRRLEAMIEQRLPKTTP